MDYEIKEAVEKDTIDFFKHNLIIPIIDFFEENTDEQCYKIFTKELADLFDEYQPNYFGSEHSQYIGQYFYSSLYGDALSEPLLIEIITADDHEKFNGLDVYFEDSNTLKYQAEDIVKGNNLSLDFFNFTGELFKLYTIQNLNKNR